MFMSVMRTDLCLKLQKLILIVILLVLTHYSSFRKITLIERTLNTDHHRTRYQKILDSESRVSWYSNMNSQWAYEALILMYFSSCIDQNVQKLFKSNLMTTFLKDIDALLTFVWESDVDVSDHDVRKPPAKSWPLTISDIFTSEYSHLRPNCFLLHYLISLENFHQLQILLALSDTTNMVNAGNAKNQRKNRA